MPKAKALAKFCSRRIRGAQKWFRSGPAVRGLAPRLRQRANLRFQERKNVAIWLPITAAPSEHGAYFVHIPKTAGTSVRAELEKHHGFQPLGPNNVTSSSRLVCVHYDTDWLVQERLIDRDFLENSSTTTFTIVRHPVARAQSVFRYLKGLETIPARWSFETFLAHVKRETPKIGGALFARTSHAAPQTSWINQANWSGPEHLFPLENLRRAEETLSRRLRKPVRFREHQNASSGPLARLSTRALNLISEIYSDDFRELGYSMDSIEPSTPNRFL